MLLFLLLAVSAPKTQGAYDEVRQLPDGQTLIMRTPDWDLGDGRHERVTVHWLLQEDGRLRYDFDRQPPETGTSIVGRARCRACSPRVAST
ncbi:hypothetical protein [Stenotrophomonas geniculata]